MTISMLWATRSAALTLALSMTAAAALAQTTPAGDETIHGTVDSLPDHYTLVLKDARGFVDTVTLGDDTIVNPANLELSSGLAVTIKGHASGKTFVADEVDGPADAVAPQQSAQQQAPPPYADQDGPPAVNPPPPVDGPYDGPAYDAAPAYGYDDAPDVIYGAPYYGPAFGIVIGGGPYGYYGGPFGYYGGGYYGGGHYGGYYGPGYYRGGYPGNGAYAPGTPGSARYPLPSRRAPGYGTPGSGYAAPTYRSATPGRSYGGSTRSYAAPAAHASAPHGSSSHH